jgi:hypothetical protein
MAARRTYRCKKTVLTGILGALGILSLAAGAASGLAASSAALETSNYRIYTAAPPPGREWLGRVSQRREEAYRRILAFLDAPGTSPKIDYHIYPSFESKGLSTGNTQLAHADIDNNAVHLVINDWIRGDDARMDAVLLLRSHFGKPPTHLLEMGLAVYFSDDWRGKGYRYWAGRLHASDNMPALAELVDNEALRRESYLVAEAAAGSFVDYLIEEFGGSVLIEHYRDWRPVPDEIQRLENGWRTCPENRMTRWRSSPTWARTPFR